MMRNGFANRVDAGRQLAGLLGAYADRSDVLVLALPRGGVPVAAEIAARLRAPLDVCLVRKIGVPGHEELAMGAIAEGGVEIVDEALVRDLGIPPPIVQQIVAREHLEIDRRDRQYRGGRPAPDVAGRTVILVDDGLATGATMAAAISAVRRHGPAAVVIAVPVGAPETCARLRHRVDGVVCVYTPPDLDAVGLWYDDFSQTTDEEVRRLLNVATRETEN